MTVYCVLVCLLFHPEDIFWGLGIEYNSNDNLASPNNDEGMPARGVISTTRWSLLSAHIICNDKFNLVVIFALSDIAHQSTYDWFLFSSVSFISSRRASSISKLITSRYAMPEYASTFVKKLIPAKVDSAFPRALLILSPPLLWSASRIPIGSWYCNIWALNSGGHQNDVWFDEEDEE